ncbi:MAG TPA: hypothetical protein VI387_07465 [Candidatus Brocadiales bacterium]|nr:type II toxin-antitoxin system VapC family toxin [Nitrospirota bacterium]HLG30033.1 hypothetical protein [Candidatus Brocadiales bacterium]
MKKVFFDTWGWVAIAHKDDANHKKVFLYYKDFLIKKGIPVTTDFILAETITLLRGRTDPKGVGLFIDTILDAVKEERILLERIDERRWERAWEMSKRFSDKPYISFFDFSSFVIMKSLGISEVVTADRHFEEAGLGFRKLF